jgi:hypothetical protein
VFGIMRVGRIHLLIYVRRRGRGRLSQQGLEDALDILRQDALAGGVRMNAVW